MRQSTREQMSPMLMGRSEEKKDDREKLLIIQDKGDVFQTKTLQSQTH